MAMAGAVPAALRSRRGEGRRRPRRRDLSQTLERALRPGEVSLDDLERAFRETTVESAPAPKAEAAAKAEAKPKPKAEPKAVDEEIEDKPDSKVANQSIRVNVERSKP